MTNASSFVSRVFSQNKTFFSNFVCQKGIEFEKYVVDVLKRNHSVIFVGDKINDNTISSTLNHMKNGVNILHSVPVIDTVNNTKGIIDLLVRSDYLQNIFLHTLPIESKKSIFGDFHYVVIDIKFSTLYLTADNIHILNSEKLRAYKKQCLVYTNAISNIQGCKSRYSYLLGRRILHSTGESYDSFDKLGVIDYEGRDSMILSFDFNRISKLQSNIKELWNCGEKQEITAFNNGITDWKHKRCNSDTLGVVGKNKDTLNKIININKQKRVKILPKKIKSDYCNWRTTSTTITPVEAFSSTPTTPVEAFLDFETFCDICHLTEKTNHIFMIGLWFNNNYISFTVNDTTPVEEERILREFNTFLTDNNISKVWYWYAEESILKRALIRHPTLVLKEIMLCDLYKLFKTEPIVIKDCFNFGLKSIGSAMFKHSFITVQNTGECVNGLEAGIKAYECFKSGVDVEKVLDSIKKYNRYDVEVLHQILDYLRKRC